MRSLDDSPASQRQPGVSPRNSGRNTLDNLSVDTIHSAPFGDIFQKPLHARVGRLPFGLRRVGAGRAMTQHAGAMASESSIVAHARAFESGRSRGRQISECLHAVRPPPGNTLVDISRRTSRTRRFAWIAPAPRQSRQ